MKFWAPKKKHHKPIIAWENCNRQLIYQNKIELNQDQMGILPKNISPNKATNLMKDQSQGTALTQALQNKVKQIKSFNVTAIKFVEITSTTH